jgi:hypothetical protein
MKSTIFCDIMPCSPLKVIRRFKGTHHFHLQGWISQAIYQSESMHCYLLSCWCHAWFIRLRRWRRYVFPEHRLSFNRLQGVIHQKTIPFLTTAARTSTPTIQSVSTDIQYFVRTFTLPVAYVCYVDVSITWLINTND